MNAPPRRPLGRVEVVLEGPRTGRVWIAPELLAFLVGFVLTGLVIMAIAVASREHP